MPNDDATLCIDIGGTGLKMMVVGQDGKPRTERLRVETPRPATTKAVLAAMKGLIDPLKVPYAQVSVGFPGVVVESVVLTAPNLSSEFEGFKLGDAIRKLTGKPTRVLNDAGMQGHAVITGRGTELCVTLGTGMGFALYVDGKYVPNIEMAHHPYRDDATYEQYIGNRALDEVGKKRWNKRVRKVVERLLPIFNPRVIYLGGGNAKKLEVELPENVKVVENTAGLLGGVKLWDRSPSP